MADHDAHAADAEARAASDKKVVDNTNKASNCCKENCGALGRCLAGCKEKFDTRVKETPLNRFRLGLRFCNMFMAVVVLFCVLLGLVSLGIDSYGAFVLSAFLLVGGIILLILEMVCCCPEFEGRLRRNLPFLYYARGRAWLVVLFAVLAFGMGVIPILIGVFCLLPYGLLSRYCIAIHPACGNRLVTTQSADEIAEIEAQGMSVYDHFTILDVVVEAELMTTTGISKLTTQLGQVNGRAAPTPTEVSGTAPGVGQAALPGAEPEHQEPGAATDLSTNPFDQKQDDVPVAAFTSPVYDGSQPAGKPVA